MIDKKEIRRWSVSKRLEFIDFKLFWEGQINRSDIQNRFGVSVPQASNDLKEYIESAPENLNYDHKQKRYFASCTFKPAFLNPDSDNYLWQMRDDVAAMSGVDSTWVPDLPIHDIVWMPRRNISPHILQQVLAGVRSEKAIEIFYQSMSSDTPSWRSITPHAFAFDGMRWHVRAFCHKSGRYKDFLLSRVQKTRQSSEKPVTGAQDSVWHEFFTVTLKPHPKLSESQAGAVALDYGMKDMRLNVKVRLALLYYFLRRLGLTDSEEDGSNHKEQHVVIANKAETRKAMERINYDINENAVGKK